MYLNTQAFKKIGIQTIRKLFLPCSLLASYISSAEAQPANNKKKTVLKPLKKYRNMPCAFASKASLRALLIVVNHHVFLIFLVI